MISQPVSQSVKGGRRRLGRPPSKIKKVSRSVRIPTDVDAFLAEYGQEHGLLIGDVITKAVLHFRTNSLRSTSTAVRAASAR
jgi:hypothetical protein